MDRFDDELQSVETWAAILDLWRSSVYSDSWHSDVYIYIYVYAKLKASYFEDVSDLAPGKSLQNIARCITMYITQWKIIVCCVDHLVFIGK